jgi:hypothetical protein
MSEYPQIGSIVVDKGGSCLVHVWPNESDDSRCFTGVNLFGGDCSVMWLRSNFERCSLFKPGLLRLYRDERKRTAVVLKGE